LKKEHIIKTNNIENLKNEKRILEKIDSYFIIKLKFTFQTREKIFMAFDYYNGGELFFFPFTKISKVSRRDGKILCSRNLLRINLSSQ